MAQFSSLDDLALQLVLSCAGALELLSFALLNRSILTIARSDELWGPRTFELARRYPLGGWSLDSRNGMFVSPHVSTRVPLSGLLSLSVKALRGLCTRLAVNPRQLALCNEKIEIANLVRSRQSELAAELAAARARVGANNRCGADYRSMEREWVYAAFGSYWSGLRDLRRVLIFSHELVAPINWAMYWRPEAVAQNTEENPLLFSFFHTVLRFENDGTYDSDDAQLNTRNTNQRWERRVGVGGRFSVVSPHNTYPPLTAMRTPAGGWRLDNSHIVLLRESGSEIISTFPTMVWGASTCNMHYGPAARETHSEPPPPPAEVW
jgi:hypothetical protein